MIELIEKEKCCGCSSCASVCIKGALRMKEDVEGFLFPSVNAKLCVKCGACVAACPITNGDNFAEAEPKAYAATCVQDDLVCQCSSGGVFALLAKQILNQSGCVFGAAFTKQMVVEHICVEHENELKALFGSKYVQSSIGSSYILCKNELQKNRRVLFTGTPCQVAGLKQFLKKEYDNLLTMEVICHGVPSPKILKKHIANKEKKTCMRIVNFCFRSKKTGWENYSVEYKYEDGSIESVMHRDDLYSRVFLSNLALRKSCYTCEFKNGKSGADITCGDFWGIENVVPQMYSDKGVSLVLCHSDKGRTAFDKILPELVFEQVDFNDAVVGNPSYLYSTRQPAARKLFFNDINKKNIEVCIHYFCDDDRKTQAKVLFREDMEAVQFQKGTLYSYLWAMKNIRRLIDLHKN